MYLEWMNDMKHDMSFPKWSQTREEGLGKFGHVIFGVAGNRSFILIFEN